MSSKFKTIDDIEQEKTGPIFVLNNTSGTNRSQIVFTVPKSNGVGLDNVEVSATFIPLNLLEQVSRRQLLSSSEFRRAVSRKYIVLLDTEYAKVLLAEEGVAEEQQRLENLHNAQTAALENGALQGNPAMPDDDGMKLNGVTAGVVAAVERLGVESDETLALNTFRALGALEVADYKFIRTHLGKKFPRVEKWCNRSLANAA